MPRTKNREVTYTIEYDIPALMAMGKNTYFQTDRVKESLSMIGDAFVVQLGRPTEFWPPNLERARTAVKQAAEDMIVADDIITDGTVYAVNQETGDFSSWNIAVKFRLLS